jgi:phosphopantetheine adenylyltransferase
MDEEKTSAENNLIEFQIHRNVINISVDFLEILEDLKKNGYLNCRDEILRHYRKRVLDNSNKRLRELKDFIKKFNFELNRE